MVASSTDGISPLILGTCWTRQNKNYLTRVIENVVAQWETQKIIADIHNSFIFFSVMMIMEKERTICTTAIDIIG
uniref:Uncharacterized protein n=1 Tax=Arundo donax TaxID=35708 RepID=A0A0A9HGN8_ARUDO